MYLLKNKQVWQYEKLMILSMSYTHAHDLSRPAKSLHNPKSLIFLTDH